MPWCATGRVAARSLPLERITGRIVAKPVEILWMNRAFLVEGPDNQGLFSVCRRQNSACEEDVHESSSLASLDLQRRGRNNSRRRQTSEHTQLSQP
jgi:hypothetical protein